MKSHATFSLIIHLSSKRNNLIEKKMKKLNLILVAIIVSMFLFICEKYEKDKVKNVDLTIHPETKFSRSELSDTWSDALVISDSEDKEQRALYATITEGLDYNDYERGYEYIYKLKKVWMQNPPQDVSSIKYIFLELLSKKKVITENSEKDIQLYILPQRAEYTPRFLKDGVEDEPQRNDAMLVENMSNKEWLALIDIEGFDFEAGYEYVMNVKEMTIAEPYSKSYSLGNVVSKEVSEKEWPGVVYN